MRNKDYMGVDQHLARAGDRHFHVNASAEYWEREGLNFFKRLFSFTAKTIIPYANLLKEKGLENYVVDKKSDMIHLPIIDKNSYLRVAPLDTLIAGSVSEITTFASSSGSTGKPIYIPRSCAQDLQYSYIAENILTFYFGSTSGPAVCFLGFGLGVWIGGIFTYKVINFIGEKRGGFSVVPIGPNAELFYGTFKKLRKYYNKIILMGYPPFIKDLIMEAKNHGVDFGETDVRILTAAEGFSEKFREKVLSAAGIENNVSNLINIYGTVELGTMAHETPIANLIRRIADERTDVFKALFGNINKMPTLCQYYPFLTYFEEINGGLVASGFGSFIPLVRYDLKDRGGVIPYHTMIKKLKECGVDVIRELRSVKELSNLIKLPFVYVYERNDMSVSLFGIVIHADHVKGALENDGLSQDITGKFAMIVREDNHLRQVFEIHIELRPSINPTRKRSLKIRDVVIESLRSNITEYHYLYGSVGASKRYGIEPRIIQHYYGDPKFFQKGVKQRWVL